MPTNRLHVAIPCLHVAQTVHGDSILAPAVADAPSPAPTVADATAGGDAEAAMAAPPDPARSAGGAAQVDATDMDALLMDTGSSGDTTDASTDEDRPPTGEGGMERKRKRASGAQGGKKVSTNGVAPSLADCRYFRGVDALRFEAKVGLHDEWVAYSTGDIESAVRWLNRVVAQALASPGEVVKLGTVGGSITISHKRKKELGLPVLGATDARLRLCAAHAALLLCRRLWPDRKGRESSQAWFEKELPGTLDPADDPTSGDIARVLGKRCVRLEPAYNLSPHALIQRSESVFLVHMFATVEGDHVRHFFVFDAESGCLLDPDAAAGEQVEDSDRCLHAGGSKEARKKANCKAIDVFYKAYPGADKGSIKINCVWRATRA